MLPESLVHVELNREFVRALEVMESTRSAFITGKAGTGKSTLLQYFRAQTQKKVAVLAPTGVSALNVQGETVHSFFGFKPDVTQHNVKKVYGAKGRLLRELDALVVDEASMLRADLLDCVDASLRLNRQSAEPFGGLQMLLIGDLFQLPPVVTGGERDLFRERYPSPYFFDADALRGFPLELVELDKVYRQKDERFIHLLNAIRNGQVSRDDMDLLNQRHGAQPSPESAQGLRIHLTTTNLAAREINLAHLQALNAKVLVFPAQIAGEFKEHAFPADRALEIAEGAQVMLLNNDLKGRWVNGTMGRVTGLRKRPRGEPDVISVELADGQSVDVPPFTWEMFHFRFNQTSGRVETEPAGAFTQYPVKLAWAVTIHKSQGKTFDRVVIDMGRGAFAPGQTYVALSRCRTLEGIVLATPIQKRHLMVDQRIVEFMGEREVPA